MPQSKKEIDRVCEKIQRYLRNDDYEPDVICSHFLHPSLEIISKLKEVYNVPVGVTIHGEISDKRDVSSIINKKNVLDFWGFRSVPIKNSFIKNCFVPQHHFICSSGIPESYIVDSPLKKHSNNGVTNFIFVGNLIKRKHPLTLVKALDRANINYICTIIGTGSENKAIKKYINKNKRTNVNLLGRLDRLQVLEQMALAECFVMISSSETFGLVYLEAMSKGCITIASRNEGMEGIIIDGENGFLCEAGNGKELSEIIKKINNLDIAEKTKIACNAIDTARRYTDYNVATSYLRELQNL
jgi:glycosyltransferase involved in cell wall biosynthesis